MSHVDVNAFIADLDKRGELARISEPVDPHLEISALVDRVSKTPGGGPGLLWRRGSWWRHRHLHRLGRDLPGGHR